MICCNLASFIVDGQQQHHAFPVTLFWWFFPVIFCCCVVFCHDSQFLTRLRVISRAFPVTSGDFRWFPVTQFFVTTPVLFYVLFRWIPLNSVEFRWNCITRVTTCERVIARRCTEAHAGTLRSIWVHMRTSKCNQDTCQGRYQGAKLVAHISRCNKGGWQGGKRDPWRIRWKQVKKGEWRWK